MTSRRSPAWVLALSIALATAQTVDLAWPRTDTRAASPASVLAAAALMLLLAVYPTGRPVPRWTAPVAAVGVALFAAAAILGPDAAARVLWPLPLAPLVLALALGGQGWRYARRASAAEREAARWPLLGILILLTLVVPADLVSVALTGGTLEASPALDLVVQSAFLLPAVGFITGALAPRTDLVDRLLALWVAVVAAAASLSVVFGAVFLAAGALVPAPWPAWLGAGAVAAASVWIVPLSARLGGRVVFRGRADRHRAVELLNARLRTAVDAGEIPAEVAASLAAATGSQRVVIRRWGHTGPWAAAGTDAAATAGDPWSTTVTHLALPVATIEVLPRPGESALASADRRIVEAMATAAAPALHSARLASAFPELTDRERQVLAGIVRGLPNSAIASRLGVSSKTVANYVSIVLTKLHVPDKERAAELARRRAGELA